MSRLIELRSAYEAYCKSEQEFVEGNNKLADLIVGGLRDYIGLPNSYDVNVNGEVIFKPYTPSFRLDDSGNSTKVDFLQDAVTHLTDGSFYFGFGLTLDSAANTFPKQALQIRVDCKRDAEKASVNVNNETVVCNFTGSESHDISKVHEKIFVLVMEWLQSRPGDGQTHQKIGFKLGK